MVELFELTKINHWVKDATGGGATGTTYWVDTTHCRFTVPAGKRWIILGGIVKRGVAATCLIYLRDVAGENVLKIFDEAAAANTKNWPESVYQIGVPYVADAGEDITATFGVAQDATSEMSCVVMEMEM